MSIVKESRKRSGDGKTPPPANEAPAGAGDGQASHETPLPVGRRRKPVWNNVITLAGLFLVLMAGLLFVSFALFSLVSPVANPYVDVVGYVVLPGVLLLGLIAVPLGIFVKSWRLRRRDPTQALLFRPVVMDLSDPQQRRAAKILVGGTFALIPIVGVASYHGYKYTDSTSFCAYACHSVMEPQATAYEHSPHARVSCSECHIGEGASWFVRSKLSGTRQVLAVWRNSFPRPIPPAIQNLRPARETCERCHWPKKFYGAQLQEIVHFAADETNTRREIDMLLKIGGGDETMGRPEGIHLHMALAGRIEYIATDDKLQHIPWVRYVDEAGREWIYRSDGLPSSDPPPEGQVRRLDCMDCHNRPAHKFRSPQEAVDVYLSTGRIDTTLPYIKREAVAALVKPYPDVESAMIGIREHLTTFYREKYPDIWEADRASVNLAVDRVRDIYRRNFFPQMQVDWRTYPDNIGHLYSPGCFRCHEGRHVNQEGKAISHACNTCHLFLNPVTVEGKPNVIQKGEFVHPYKLQGSHRALQCSACHTGGTGPVPDCAGCHTDVTAWRNGGLPGFADVSLPPDPMAGLDCDACHDLSEPATPAAYEARCLDCHEDEEEPMEGIIGRWRGEARSLLARLRAKLDPQDQPLLDRIRRAGTLHNLSALRALASDPGLLHRASATQNEAGSAASKTTDREHGSEHQTEAE